MGKASKIQNSEDWDLEETVRQVEQKFATDLKTTAGETTNDEKFLKTLVCLERRTYEQIPEEYREYKKNISTRFGVVFYDDKIMIPKSLRQTVIILLHKGHPAITKCQQQPDHFGGRRSQKTSRQNATNASPVE